MEFITIEMLEKLLSPKDLVTVGVIWFLVKGKVANHFKSIENSLVTIGQNIQSLKDSILKLEKTQTEQINDLSERVTKLEEKK
jgi:DNA anti-recombination protein RmuC